MIGGMVLMRSYNDGSDRDRYFKSFYGDGYNDGYTGELDHGFDGELDDGHGELDNFKSDSSASSERPRRAPAGNPRQSAARKKARRKKLIIRRTKIVIGGLLILAVLITLIVLLINAIVSGVSQSAEPTVAPTVAATEPVFELEFKTPDIPDDKKTDGSISDNNADLFVYNKAAFEVLSTDENTPNYYADCISDFKKKAGKDFKVYNMVVPNHTEFGLPRRFIDEGKVTSASQADNIKQIYTSYSDDVIPINCYNKLSEHCKEYIYFNTDDHWTGLGAYYAYTAFCEQTDNKTLDIGVCTEHTIDGFEGTYAYADSSLYENLDTVHFWTFPYDTYAMRTESGSTEPYEISVYYEAEGSGPYSYGVFLWGDCPLFVEYNKELTNGKKIAVVKDSYGNAFAPYLTANYEEVHVIDFRYFEDDLLSYCKQNGINEVLFLNNTLAANSTDNIASIRSLFK